MTVRKIAILLAMLMMALPAFAEGFTGVWQDPAYDRATLTILPDGEAFAIELNWAGSSEIRGEWRMTGHAEGNALVYENGTKTDAVYGEEGALISGSVQWDDAKGSLTLTESDTLTWMDSREERAADFSFQRENLDAPAAAEMVSDYLEVVAGLEVGSAGYSLKLAKATYNILRFALDRQLWNADADELQMNLLVAWEALGEERQTRFSENYPEIAALVNDVFSGWEDARYTFEDAGVAEEMTALLDDRALFPSWQALADATDRLQ